MKWCDMKNINKLNSLSNKMHSVSKQRFYILNIISLATFQMYNLCIETQGILLDIILWLLVPAAPWSKA